MRAAFVTVFPGSPKAKENDIKVFYAAEIDGLDSKDKHVEVKTQAFGLWKGRFFQQKAMKWWIQNYVVGIDDLIVGIRDKKGIVSRLEKVNLQYIRKGCTGWDGNVCLRTFQHIINQVKINYDKYVTSDEALIIEKKPNEKKVFFQTIPKKSADILTPEFRTRFGKP